MPAKHNPAKKRYKYSAKFTTGTGSSNYKVSVNFDALTNAWKGYKVAQVQKNTRAMQAYARIIRNIQKQLGVGMAKFPELGLT